MVDFVSISHNTLKRDFSHFHNKRRSLHFQNIETIPGPVVGRPRHLLQRKRTMLGPTVMVARVAKVVRRREGLSPKSLNSDVKFKP